MISARASSLPVSEKDKKGKKKKEERKRERASPPRATGILARRLANSPPAGDSHKLTKLVTKASHEKKQLTLQELQSSVGHKTVKALPHLQQSGLVLVLGDVVFPLK